MKRTSLCVAICVVALALVGCTHTESKLSTSSTVNWSTQQKRVLLMAPEIKLGELGASGLVDWRADWTKTGREFVNTDIKGTLTADGIDVADSGEVTDPHAIQLIKLHNAVGNAIRIHTVGNANFKLPTKSDPLDFTLGPGVQDLRQKYGADYALFIDVTDTYSSASRKALQVAGILTSIVGVAVYVPGGEQVGFASLVDLKTGNVVWFNMLTSSTGDLRDPKGAQTAVANLLKGMPL
jgi:hypothetical protein